MLPTRSLDVIRRPEAAAALLDPIRQRLLAQLAEPDSASGLARRLRLPRQRINYHLRALEAAGLLELVEERRKGNCTERVVRATARAFVISPEALGPLGLTPDLAADRFSSAYLIAAAGRAIRDVSALVARARGAGQRIATLTLEADIRFASAESRAAFAEELAEQVARIAARYHDERAPGGRSFRLLAAVHPTPTKGAKHGKDHD
jgi:DNA-binding transcriptional ArsR family regulator